MKNIGPKNRPESGLQWPIANSRYIRPIAQPYGLTENCIFKNINLLIANAILTGSFKTNGNVVGSEPEKKYMHLLIPYLVSER